MKYYDAGRLLGPWIVHGETEPAYFNVGVRREDSVDSATKSRESFQVALFGSLAFIRCCRLLNFFFFFDMQGLLCTQSLTCSLPTEVHHSGGYQVPDGRCPVSFPLYRTTASHYHYMYPGAWLTALVWHFGSWKGVKPGDPVGAQMIWILQVLTDVYIALTRLGSRHPWLVGRWAGMEWLESRKGS